MTYKEVVLELKEIIDLLDRYHKKEDMFADFDYKKTTARLSYLRNRKRMFPKKQKNKDE